MSEQTEEAFADYVERRLVEEYGAGSVEREPRLPSGRVPDFLVYRWPVPIAVELENTAEEAIQGAGQAIQYAGEADAHPVVLYPAQTGEDEIDPELRAVNRRVPVRRVA